ncbi:site-2 protease family protein [Arthrobacter caoxuetaonis]|uniref:site-2 protease family protein n=1 Tax=Arthrobacter caoxuetaonis TaxID=2886935 RepID=UPI001D13FEA5|nr:site-2 protease family protein [Arthrobacter caoxuetaonis]MCC3283398.1 site-2 protease family protein [Arthrobacter caoxuetaonis]
MTQGPDAPKKERSEGIPLGRIGGVPVTLAWSWFVIAAAIVFLFGPRVASVLPQLGGIAPYAVALGYALLLLLSVLVHELAHALTAQAWKWPTPRIVLTLWGGHTQFGDVRATPGKSLLVALAGPAANFVLALCGRMVLPFLEPGTVAWLLTDIFVWANILVAVFNVLPGLPLDGGRIVETIVWKVTGVQEKGTVAAGWAGRIIAVALVAAVFIPPYLQGRTPGLSLVLVTALVSGFLWMGASAAITNARMRLRLPAISAAALMEPARQVPTGMPVLEARRIAAEAGTGTALVVTAATGRPEAVVDNGALFAVPDEYAAGTPVDAAARALAPGAYIPNAATGQELIQYLSKLSGSEYAVIDKEGTVVGLLRQATVVAAITGRRPKTVRP